MRHGIERVKRVRIEDEKHELLARASPSGAPWETDSVLAEQHKARNAILVNLPPSATRDIDGPKHWRHLHRNSPESANPLPLRGISGSHLSIPSSRST